MNLADVAIGGGVVAMAMAAAGAIYDAGAAFAFWRFTRRPRDPAPAAWPSVTVLKPLHGAEPELDENLASFCAQDYAGPVQLILGAQNPSDPALAVAAEVKQSHPEADILLAPDPTPRGSNRKVGNLINMAAHATGEVIVISDSDVRLPADGLSRIVAALRRPGVGLVHCYYRGRPAGNLWSRLAALDNNARFAASVAVGEALGAHPCQGPTMALDAALLTRIGGFERLADVLADDFVLGAAVRETGLALASPPLVIDHLFPERSARDVLVHELRWARTIRRVQPGGYVGSVITHVLPLALIGAALTGFAPWAVALLAALTALRCLHAFLLCRLIGGDLSVLWLTPARDLLSFAVFLAALSGDRIEWRGRALKVGRDGAMAPQ